MADATPTLGYGPPAPRRRRRVVAAVVLLIACGAAAAGWRYRGPIQSRVTEHYAAWRFARAFDRATRDLVGDGSLWLAAVADAPPDDRAGRHLRSLFTLSLGGPSIRSYHAGRVLFATTGERGGRRWLAFAYASGAGFEMFAFERNAREAVGHDLLMTTPAFRDVPAERVVLRSIRTEGDAVRMQLDVKGGRNEILWSFEPGAADRGRGPLGTSFMLPSVVTPLTGWAAPAHWSPVPAGWRLVEGRPPTRKLSTDGGGATLTFLPDGRLASAGPFRVSLIGVDSDERKRHGLPLDLSPSTVFNFSSDGTRLFVGGTSQAAGLVDVLTGKVRRYSYSTSGRARATFADEKTLLVMDNVQRVRVNWDTLALERLKIGDLDAGDFGAAGERVAVPQSGEAVVIDLPGTKTVAQFETIPGLLELSLAPGGRWLAMRGQLGLRLIDVDAAARAWEHDAPYNAGRVKWSAGGARGAAVAREWVYVWEMSEPRWAARFPHGLSGDSYDVALSTDGKRMAVSAEGSKTIAYWPDVDAAVGSPDAGGALKSEAPAGTP